MKCKHPVCQPYCRDKKAGNVTDKQSKTKIINKNFKEEEIMSTKENVLGALSMQNLLDRHNMKIYTSKQDDELVSEIEFYSGLGEDFVMTVFWDGTAKGFTDSIKQFNETFDPYEHAAQYINMNYNQRIQAQVPYDNEALMNDALNIKEEIKKFVDDLNKHYTKK